MTLRSLVILACALGPVGVACTSSVAAAKDGGTTRAGEREKVVTWPRDAGFPETASEPQSLKANVEPLRLVAVPVAEADAKRCGKNASCLVSAADKARGGDGQTWAVGSAKAGKGFTAFVTLPPNGQGEIRDVFVGFLSAGGKGWAIFEAEAEDLWTADYVVPRLTASLRADRHLLLCAEEACDANTAEVGDDCTRSDFKARMERWRKTCWLFDTEQRSALSLAVTAQGLGFGRAAWAGKGSELEVDHFIYEPHLRRFPQSLAEALDSEILSCDPQGFAESSWGPDSSLRSRVLPDGKGGLEFVRFVGAQGYSDETNDVGPYELAVGCDGGS